MDDLIQVGHIGVWDAASTYDPDGGKSWAAWAAWHIQREIRALLGIDRRRADMGATSLDAPLTDAEGDTLGDLIADDSLPEADDALLREEVREEVRAAVARLPTDQQTAVRARGLEGASYAAIAAANECTEQEAQNAYKRGLRALRHDAALRQMDDETRFYAHKGVRAFNADWTSTTEEAALWRLERRKVYDESEDVPRGL